MFRIFFFILGIGALSYGLSFLADIDGKVIIEWPGGIAERSFIEAMSYLFVIVFVLLLIWSLFRFILNSPEALSRYFSRKKQEKGLAALSGGLIALGSGDKLAASRLAGQARKTLPNDPMTQLLRAQTAQMEGDTAQATKLYESMLASSDTEIMGLRGLYLLALEQKAFVAAEQYAARAVKRRQDLQWAGLGLFDLQCKRENWNSALETLKILQDHRHLDGKIAKKYRAVLLTAMALDLEDSQMDEALDFASQAVKLAPTFVPGAVVAGRINASKGQTNVALKIIRKCWKENPHPDLAVVSAYARPGDSVQDRLNRIQSLANITPGHKEGAMAVAQAAYEAKDWALARASLGALVRGRPTQNVCTLMARIEAQETGNKGLVREWLARAVQAPLDPQWVADGVVRDEWAPISPVTGKLDAFAWRVPDDHNHEDDEAYSLKQMIAGLLTAEGLDHEDVVEGKTQDYEDNLPVIVEQDDGEDEPEEELSSAPDERSASDDEIEVIVPEIIEPEVVETPADEAVEPKVEKKLSRKAKKRQRRTKIFVAPPAPDDPGPERKDRRGGSSKGRRSARY